MKKSRATISTVPYIAHVHRQHNSLVTTIPKGLCNALDITKGDIVNFELQCGLGYAIFKVQLKGVRKDVQNAEHTVRKDKGRRA